MQRSEHRILTTHAGSLPRPDDLRELLNEKQNRQLEDEGAFTNRVRSAVDEVVQLQLGSGVDCVNDGERRERQRQELGAVPCPSLQLRQPWPRLIYLLPTFGGY